MIGVSKTFGGSSILSSPALGKVAGMLENASVSAIFLLFSGIGKYDLVCFRGIEIEKSKLYLHKNRNAIIVLK